MGSRGLPFIIKKMEKLFSDAQFGTFVFHHMQHNVGSMCKTKRYLKEQWLIKQKVFFSWCLLQGFIEILCKSTAM